jgi:asparagine synthetase B (glutamine-hydrolysing)
VLTGEGSDETLGGYTRYPWTLLNSRMDSVYRTLTPAALRRLLRESIHLVPLSATTKRKLEHTFLLRDGESWASFYFDSFYSAFPASEQNELLTPEASRSAGDAYAGSMTHWDNASGDLLHRLLYTDIKTYLVELLMKQDQMSMAASIESRVPAGGIQREHTREIFHQRNGGEMHSEISGGGSAARRNRSPPENGFPNPLGLLACGTAARGFGAPSDGATKPGAGILSC